jgi:hypothetical protein
MHQRSIGILTVVMGVIMSVLSAGWLAVEFNRIEPWFLGVLFVFAISGSALLVYGFFILALSPRPRRIRRRQPVTAQP